MNRYAEMVMALFVGGCLGRLMGHTFVVGYLGLPEFTGWLSVPIGSAIGWIMVEVKSVAPALKHAYRWTRRPVSLAFVTESLNRIGQYADRDWRVFRKGWRWRMLGATSIGLLIGLWAITILVLGISTGLSAARHEASGVAQFCACTVFTFAIGVASYFTLILGALCFRYGHLTLFT